MTVRPSFSVKTVAAYWSLITLLGSTIDSSRSRTLKRPDDDRQVRAQGAALVVEAVAAKALGLAEQLPAAVEVALASGPSRRPAPARRASTS